MGSAERGGTSRIDFSGNFHVACVGDGGLGAGNSIGASGLDVEGQVVSRVGDGLSWLAGILGSSGRSCILGVSVDWMSRALHSTAFVPLNISGFIPLNISTLHLLGVGGRLWTWCTI